MQIPVVLTFLCICSMTLRKGILMIHVNHQKGLRVSNSTEVCVLQQSNVWLSIIPGPWPPLTWPVCSPGLRFAEKYFYPTPVIHDGDISQFLYTDSSLGQTVTALHWITTPLSSVFIWQTLPPPTAPTQHTVFSGEHSSDQHLAVTWERFMAQELRSTPLRSTFKIFSMH